MTAKSLITHPAHLGRAGLTTSEPEYGGGMSWYEDYSARHADDGVDGRLVSEFHFTQDWDGWECHPNGGELVYCLAGTLTLHQEMGGGEIVTTVLRPGDYAINPPGVWHTADVAGEARALFITAGLGTQHRPR